MGIYSDCSKYFTSPSPILLEDKTISNNIKKVLEDACFMANVRSYEELTANCQNPASKQVWYDLVERQYLKSLHFSFKKQKNHEKYTQRH